MSNDALRSPLAFFESVLGPYAPLDPGIMDYAAQWAADDGQDVWQQRDRGYAARIIQRVHKQESLLPSAAMLYITAFYAPALASEYIASLLVRHIVDKYAPDDVQPRLLSRLQAASDYWRGAVWIEADSALIHVRQAGSIWQANGTLLFEADADANLIAADGLFLVTRLREDGTENIAIAPDGTLMLHESQAWLMGRREDAAALRMEVETLRMALSTIALLGAYQRVTQNEARQRAALVLAWAAMQVGDDTAREIVGLYSATYQRFRLLARLADHFRHANAPMQTDDSEAARALVTDLSEYLPEGPGAGSLAETVANAYLRKFEAACAILR